MFNLFSFSKIICSLKTNSLIGEWQGLTGRDAFVDRTDLLQHFFIERVINLWNSLDEEFVSAVSVNSFKGKLQKLHTVEAFPRLSCKRYEMLF